MCCWTWAPSLSTFCVAPAGCRVRRQPHSQAVPQGLCQELKCCPQAQYNAAAHAAATFHECRAGRYNSSRVAWGWILQHHHLSTACSFKCTSNVSKPTVCIMASVLSSPPAGEVVLAAMPTGFCGCVLPSSSTPRVSAGDTFVLREAPSCSLHSC